MSADSLLEHLQTTFDFHPPAADSRGVRDVRLPEGGAGDISYPEDGIDLLQVHAEASWWIQHRVRHVATLLRDAGIRQLVDVGAGSGVMGERLGAEGIPTLSVEPHYSGAAGIARRGLDVFCGTLQQAAFPESSLPAVGLFDVIEHLPSPDALLREVRRVVADDGVVVVTVPAHSWLWGEEDDYAGHHRRYNRKRLVAEMATAGFAPTYTSHLFVCLVPPALVARRIPYLLGVRQGEAKMQANLSKGLAPSELVTKALELVLRLEDSVQRLVPLPLGLSVIGLFRPV